MHTEHYLMQYGQKIRSYFQSKQPGKLEYSTNTSIFNMYDPWQCYNFGTEIFNFLYVTILNVGDLDVLGFVEELPFKIAGVTQLNSQTPNFDFSAPSQPSPCIRQNKPGQFCNGSQNPPPQNARNNLFISMQKQLQPAVLCPKSKILIVSMPFTKSIFKLEKNKPKIF